MKNIRGMTLIEMVVAIGVVGIVVLGIMSYRGSMGQNAVQSRTVASRDRILASIRSIAGIPAALRNSARALNGTALVNPQLQACVIGPSAGDCVTGTSYGFMLYSPNFYYSATGTVLGVTPLTLAGPPPATPTTGQVSGFDSFGTPCGPTGQNCPFQIFTTFAAQCAPAPLPSPTPSPIPVADLQPQASCQVAELINTTYWIVLDPLAASIPGLAPLSTPMSGTVSTPVVLISGNVPQ